MTRAVLHPGVRSGLRHPEARHWRISSRGDGAVVVTGVDGTEDVVARPGEVTRAVLVPAADVARRTANRFAPRPFSRTSDVMALLGDERVLVAVLVHAVHQGRLFGGGADFRLHRATSGIADFALTLGVPLEPATEADVALVNASRGVITEGPLSDRIVRQRRLHALLTVWVIVGLIVLATNAEEHHGDPGWMSVLTLFTAVPAMWLSVTSFLGSRRFVAQPRLPHSPTRTEVPNVADASLPTWILEAQLQIGADDVVLKEYAFEFWVPGPAHGGVVTCVIGWDAILFLDRHRVELLSVPAAMWVGPDDDALRQACNEAGINVEHRPDATLPPSVAAEYDPAIHRSGQAMLYSLPLGDWGSPMLVTGIVTGIVGAVLIFAGLGLPFRYGFEPTDVLTTVVGVIVLVLSLATTIGLRWWERRLRKVGTR